MRKLFISEMVTVDGFFAGPHEEIDWHNVDEEFNEFAIAQLKSVGLQLYGRVTYELMNSYWPTDLAKKDDPTVAGLMNAAPKIVFSKTMKIAEWENTTVSNGDVVTEVRKLKEQPGKDIIIFGSGQIVSILADAGLIDEFRLFVAPVVLGKGKSLFAGVSKPLQLTLLRTQEFKSGNVLECYAPKV